MMRNSRPLKLKSRRELVPVGKVISIGWAQYLYKKLKQIISITMQEDRKKQLAHETLNKNGFYRLSMFIINEILRLLDMPEARDAKLIQKNAINGLLRVVGQHRSKIERHFYIRKFADISEDTKNYLMVIVDNLISELLKERQAETTRREEISQVPFFPIPPINFQNYAGVGFNGERGMGIVQQDQIRMQNQMGMYFYDMYNRPNPMLLNQMGFPYSQFNGLENRPMPNVPIPFPLQGSKNNVSFLPNYQGNFTGPLSLKPVKKEIDSQNKESQIMFFHAEKQALLKRVEEDKNEALPNRKLVQTHTVEVQTDLELVYKEFQVIRRPEKLKSLPQIDRKGEVVEEQEQEKNDPLIYEIKGSGDYKQNKFQRNDPPEIRIEIKDCSAQQANVVVQQNESYDELEKEGVKINLPAEDQEKQIRDIIVTLNQGQLYSSQVSPIQERSDNIHLVPVPELSEPSSFDSPQEQFFDPLSKIKQRLDLKLLKFRQEQRLTHCYCRGEMQSDIKFECVTCRRKYHCECMKEKLSKKDAQCPFCKLQFADPFLTVKQVIAECYISNITQKQFQVQLSLRHYQYYCTRRIRDHQIDLRCYKMNEDADATEITFPDECQISLNGHKIAQTHNLPMKSSLKKRKDFPITITSNIFENNRQLDFENEQMTTLRISVKKEDLSQQKVWKRPSNNEGVFMLGIYFVKRLKVEELYNKIMADLEACDDNYMQRLMETQGENEEAEVIIDRVDCTLEDPYSWKTMSVPVRGKGCLHGQCFDLKTYLIFMNMVKNRNWRCPICQKDAKSFLLDKHILQLIQRSAFPSTIPSKVTFLKDGRILLKMSSENDKNECVSDQSESKTKKIVKRRRRRDYGKGAQAVQSSAIPKLLEEGENHPLFEGNQEERIYLKLQQ